MGKPLVEFKDLFLTHFFREAYDDSFLRDYCARLRRALEPFYSSVSISEGEFARAFALPRGIDVEPLSVPSYHFLARTDSEEERWMLGLRRTQISHLFGGIKQRSSLTYAIDPEVARSLISEEVADVVVYAQKPSTKPRSRWLIRNSLSKSPNLVGTRLGLYIFLKIEAISELQGKLRWKRRNESDDWFPSFLRSLESTLGDEAQSVVGITFDSLKTIRAFLSECDGQVLSRITRGELTDVLVPTGVGLEEWLDAKL